MHTLFQIRNLSVRFQDKTLLEIDQLDIPSGMTVIIGPNGAGKSTLLRALIGQTGQGGITLFGEAVAPQIRAGRVAWVGQHGRYNMPMTVREYIALASFVQKGRLNHEWADELLDYFDLTALADKRIGKLSGGEQQRANIIRALYRAGFAFGRTVQPSRYPPPTPPDAVFGRAFKPCLINNGITRFKPRRALCRTYYFDE